MLYAVLRKIGLFSCCESPVLCPCTGNDGSSRTTLCIQRLHHSETDEKEGYFELSLAPSQSTDRVLTTLEKMEVSGEFVNSGKLTQFEIYSREFFYIRCCFFRDAI